MAVSAKANGGLRVSATGRVYHHRPAPEGGGGLRQGSLGDSPFAAFRPPPSLPPLGGGARERSVPPPLPASPRWGEAPGNAAFRPPPGLPCWREAPGNAALLPPSRPPLLGGGARERGVPPLSRPPLLGGGARERGVPPLSRPPPAGGRSPGTRRFCPPPSLPPLGGGARERSVPPPPGLPCWGEDPGSCPRRERVRGWGNQVSPSPCVRARPSQTRGRGCGETRFPHAPSEGLCLREL